MDTTLVPTDPSQADPSIVALMAGLKSNEGGTNYNALGDKNAQGQYTAAGIGQWSNEVNNVPQPLTAGQIPSNFAADAKQYGLDPTDFSPANQNKVMYAILKDGKNQGLTPEEELSKWNSGRADAYLTNPMEGSSVGSGTQNVAAYVKRGMAIAQAYAQQQKSSSTRNTTSTETPVVTPATPANPAGVSGTPSLANVGKNLAALPGEALSAGESLLPAIPDIYNDITGKNTKTALQQAGDIGSTALTAGMLIPGVDLADLGIKGALDEAPSLAARLTRGGIIGGVYGASGALGAGQTDPTQIALSTGEGAIGGAATEGLLSKILPSSTLSKSIQDTMPLENKATRIDALRSSLPSDANGGVVRKGLLGTSTIQPSTEDVARGTAADPYISKTNDPVGQIQNVNQGIVDESNKTDAFLDQNAAPANFADMREYVEANNVPDTNLQSDPAAYQNYQRATQNGLNTLAQVMTDASKVSGDYGPNVSATLIRKARIDIDQQISKELGESVFGSPQYKGIKAAELGMRNTLNRMSEDMLRYPGQLDKLNQMNDFVSTAKSRGIEVDMTNPQVRTQLETRFGLKATSEGEEAAQKLNAQHQKMSYLYDARDNLIDKYQRNIGKNKVQEVVAKSPLAKTAVGIAKKVVPYGIADHL